MNRNMTASKNLNVAELLNKKLNDLKNQYGDNITPQSIGNDLIELIEIATGYTFKNCYNYIELKYEGMKYDLYVKIYTNQEKYEVISDLTAKCNGDIDTNIFYLSKFSSVIDYLTSDILGYMGK